MILEALCVGLVIGGLAGFLLAILIDVGLDRDAQSLYEQGRRDERMNQSRSIGGIH